MHAYLYISIYTYTKTYTCVSTYTDAYSCIVTLSSFPFLLCVHRDLKLELELFLSWPVLHTRFNDGSLTRTLTSSQNKLTLLPLPIIIKIPKIHFPFRYFYPFISLKVIIILFYCNLKHFYNDVHRLLHFRRFTPASSRDVERFSPIKKISNLTRQSNHSK